MEGDFCLLLSKPINHPINSLSGSRPPHSEVQVAPESLKETPGGFFAEAAKGSWPLWGKHVNRMDCSSHPSSELHVDSRFPALGCLGVLVFRSVVSHSRRLLGRSSS